ncbi:UNKNOWN [Stylonychia lemnae]|uniref:Uncharacterized protein n=1 Tax=Stylonychia lemnae TaxID=5949 RepID=A0A078AEY9_STYLE|nr:UNKNOWN [Stylonychia lemnae]|eukprot:CDW80371.1 UNKNOWN [Stylonychia lemnae]
MLDVKTGTAFYFFVVAIKSLELNGHMHSVRPQAFEVDSNSRVYIALDLFSSDTTSFLLIDQNLGSIINKVSFQIQTIRSLLFDNSNQNLYFAGSTLNQENYKYVLGKFDNELSSHYAQEFTLNGDSKYYYDSTVQLMEFSKDGKYLSGCTSRDTTTINKPSSLGIFNLDSINFEILTSYVFFSDVSQYQCMMAYFNENGDLFTYVTYKMQELLFKVIQVKRFTNALIQPKQAQIFNFMNNQSMVKFQPVMKDLIAQIQPLFSQDVPYFQWYLSFDEINVIIVTVQPIKALIDYGYVEIKETLFQKISVLVE